VKPLLTIYRVLATMVGVFLIPLFIGWGFELWAPTGSRWHDWAGTLTGVLGPLHGMLYMFFFFAAVLLGIRMSWPVGFHVMILLFGTVPILSFWAEHRATKDVRVRLRSMDAVHAGR